MRVLIICSILVLAPILVWAEVPTGCVYIINVEKREYLSTRNLYDRGRRNVGTSKNRELWNIFPQSDYFIIRHRERDEPLYAADDGHAFDDDRRRVFTWIERDTVWQGKWHIQEMEDGCFVIKNAHHRGEYLYAADYPKSGRVYTWRGRGDFDGAEKFQWCIYRCEE